MSATSKGLFPEWEVNIEGTKFRGRHRTLSGAINSAIGKFNIANYEDLVIYVKRTAGPDIGVVWNFFCRMWREIGFSMVTEVAKRAHELDWRMRHSLPIE